MSVVVLSLASQARANRSPTSLVEAPPAGMSSKKVRSVKSTTPAARLANVTRTNPSPSAAMMDSPGFNPASSPSSAASSATAEAQRPCLLSMLSAITT